MKSLYDVFEKVLKSESWKYYHWDGKNPSVDEVFNNPLKFLKEISSKGDKYANELDIYLKDDLSEFRLRHIISTFLFGIYLYDEFPDVKVRINKQLNVFSKNINRIENNKIKQEPIKFAYYWFFLTFYHDVGYSIVNKSSIKQNIFDLANWDSINHKIVQIIKEIPCDRFMGIPDYVFRNWQNYHYYRLNYKKEYFEWSDHGIFSGAYFYNDRLYKFLELQKHHNYENNFIDDSTNLHWSKAKLEIIHSSIAWSIIGHNIWLIKSTDSEYVPIYKHFGLKGLITDIPFIDKENHSIFYLLCLIDTIEPIKYLKDKVIGENFLRMIKRIGVEVIGEYMKIDFSSYSIEYAKYHTSCLKMNHWLNKKIINQESEKVELDI